MFLHNAELKWNIIFVYVAKYSLPNVAERKLDERLTKIELDHCIPDLGQVKFLCLFLQAFMPLSLLWLMPKFMS